MMMHPTQSSTSSSSWAARDEDSPTTKRRIDISRSAHSGPSRVCVFARVRPLLSREQEQPTVVSVTDKKHLLVANPNVNEREQRYQLDHIFTQDASQRDVYEHLAPSIEDCFSGFNTTIFAYGQTGTGKTHTVLGLDLWEMAESSSLNSTGPSSSRPSTPTFDPAELEAKEHQWGLIPRAGRFIFQKIRSSLQSDPVELAFVEYRISCSYLELYNERLYDLLTYEEVRRSKHNRGLEIRQDKIQGVFVPGAAQIVIENEHDLLSLLWEGARNRAVAATNMNEHSSRSHTILQVTIERRPKDGVDLSKLPTGREELARVVRAKLNLVDLAGSETMKHHTITRKQFTNQRIAELTSINQSLSSLGNCIRALEKGAKHVPYRDSKLTRLLQDSLGGNTKTSFVVTLSPSELSRGETLSTLQFADRAKRVVVHAYANEELASGDELVKANYEIARLKAMMKSMVTAMNFGKLDTAQNKTGAIGVHSSEASSSPIHGVENIQDLGIQLLAEQKRRREVEAELTACRKQYLSVLGANKGRASVKPLVDKILRSTKDNQSQNPGGQSAKKSTYQKSLLRQRNWNETYLNWLRKCPGVVAEGGSVQNLTRPDRLTPKQAKVLTAQQRVVLAEWSVLLQSEELEVAKKALLEEREKMREHAIRIHSQLEWEEKQREKEEKESLNFHWEDQKKEFENGAPAAFFTEKKEDEVQGRIWQRPTPQQQEEDDEKSLQTVDINDSIQKSMPVSHSPSSVSGSESTEQAIHFAEEAEAAALDADRMKRLLEQVKREATEYEETGRLKSRVGPGKLMALLEAEQDAMVDKYDYFDVGDTIEDEEDENEEENMEIDVSSQTNGSSPQREMETYDPASKAGSVPKVENEPLLLWKKIFDTNTGFNYYYNRVTGESTWEKPADFATALVPPHLQKLLEM